MPLARATFDVAHAEETASRAFAILDSLDAEIVGPRSLLFDEDEARRALAVLKQKRLDLLLILQVTFTDAGMTRRIADGIGARLALWAFPEPRSGERLRLNSLCGVNLAAHALTKAAHGYRWVHCAPDAPQAAADLRRGLRRMRRRPRRRSAASWSLRPRISPAPRRSSRTGRHAPGSSRRAPRGRSRG
jgi:hypothetical protein